MKILITGGHLTPALAIIDEIENRQEKNQKMDEIFFVGRKYSYEGEKTISQEYKLITQKKITFFDLSAGKFPRSLSWYNLISYLKIPVGFINAFQLIKKIRPDIILSFGGYLALPICISAKLLKIPVITHEQTVKPGLANKIIAKFADKILLSWPDNKNQFPKNKSLITGIPLRRDIFSHEKMINLSLPDDEKLLYITGGNLGSHHLNEVISLILPILLKQYYVIHQCGESVKHQDYQKLSQIKSDLDNNLQNKYFLKSYFSGTEIGWILNRADLIIGRSGANTVAEIIALKKPAILIPLPWAAGREQEENAKIIKTIGAGEIIPQNDLTGEKLILTINLMMANLPRYKIKIAASDLSIPENSAGKIVDILYELLKKNSSSS